MENELYQAAGNGRGEKVKEILKNNLTINVNQQNRGGWGALNSSCRGGHDSIVAILLAHPDIDVNKKDINGRTPFMYACVNGHTLCVRLLLKDSRVKVMERSGDGYTPLREAAYRGRLDVIKWWIASGREMDLGEPENIYTDALWAARNPPQGKGARAIRKITNSLYSLFLFSLHLSFELQ